MSKDFGDYNGDNAVEDVRSRTDIVSLVSEYVKLRKAGKNYVGLCPFHEEKTGSFTVDPDKQLFYCFGCGTGGNAFTFLMKKEGLTFPEALERLAARAGIRLPPTRSAAYRDARNKEHKRLLDALALAQGKYREMLFGSKGASALKYLEGRGLSRETIDKFALGYAPDEWDFIALAAKRAGFDQADFDKAGLLLERPSGGFYDRFRNRVTFPIWDGGGTLIGFGGRALGDENPKYLNSPETPLFRKGRELYALNLAKPAVRQTGKVCVMEGYMDVVTSFQHGISYAVAGMGTALSREQARTLLLLSSQVYLVYDQDEAGRRASRRSIDVFREAGGRTRVVTFRGAKDPDDYLKANGAAAFEESLSQALPDIEFIYDEVRTANAGLGVEGKLRVKEAMVPILASLSSEFERYAYIEEFARDLTVSKESLDKDVETYRRKAEQALKYKQSENRDTTGYDNQGKPIPASASGETSEAAGIKTSDIEISMVRRKAEEGVIRCLIENPGLLEKTAANLSSEDFADLSCRGVFEALKKGPMESIEDQKLLGYMAELCIRSGPAAYPERQLRDCLRKLRGERLHELRETIALAERRKDGSALSNALADYQRLLKQVKSTGDAGPDLAL